MHAAEQCTHSPRRFTAVGEESSKSHVNWGKSELSFDGRGCWFRDVAEEMAAKLCAWLWCLDLVTHPSSLLTPPAAVLESAHTGLPEPTVPPSNIKLSCITSVA